MQGVCHLCKRTLEVTYCEACDHYFCDGCADAWFHRGVEWIKQLVGGRKKGCCGPEGKGMGL